VYVILTVGFWFFEAQHSANCCTPVSWFVGKQKESAYDVCSCISWKRIDKAEITHIDRAVIAQLVQKPLHCQYISYKHVTLQFVERIKITQHMCKYFADGFAVVSVDDMVGVETKWSDSW